MNGTFQVSPAGNISNLSYLMWYLMTAPPFIMPMPSIIPEVHALSGSTAYIPCHSSQISKAEDKITLMLWYRGNSTAPFFVLDARRTTVEKGKHLCLVGCSSRYHFNASCIPPSLRLDFVNMEDDGLYICRTEFKMSPTESSKVRLSIIVPPERIVITDEHGQKVEGNIGPYIQGSNINLRCEVFGGLPASIVTWWHESVLLDSKPYPTESSQELIIKDIQRQHFANTYTCHAANSNLTLPLSKSVTIMMNLKPLDVRIADFESPLTDRRKVKLSCETYGAWPKAFLTWWLNNDEIPFGNQSFLPNVTRSTLIFFPTSEDHGKKISCVAENPLLEMSAIKYQLELKVQFAPKLKLTSGTGVTVDKVREGTDLFLDCQVNANPRIPEVWWSFEGQPLHQDVSSGVIMSNQSLALQKVQRQQSGSYRCSAQNDMGAGESNAVLLRVRYAPVCILSGYQVIVAEVGHLVNVSCKVMAYPSQVTFHWSMQINGQWVNMERFTVNSTSSVLSIKPSRKFGYGMLNCSAENEIGLQKDPCAFNILPQSPVTISNCSVIHKLLENIYFINCELVNNLSYYKPTFHLEVIDEDSGNLIRNFSQNTSANFVVTDLESTALLQFVVYTSDNSGAASGSITLHVISWDDDISTNSLTRGTKNFTQKGKLKVNVTLVVIGVALLLLVIAVVTFTLVIRSQRKTRRIRKRNQRESDGIGKELNRLQVQSPDAGSSDIVEEKNECISLNSLDEMENE